MLLLRAIGSADGAAAYMTSGKSGDLERSLDAQAELAREAQNDIAAAVSAYYVEADLESTRALADLLDGREADGQGERERGPDEGLEQDSELDLAAEKDEPKRGLGQYLERHDGEDLATDAEQNAALDREQGRDVGQDADIDLDRTGQDLSRKGGMSAEQEPTAERAFDHATAKDKRLELEADPTSLSGGYGLTLEWIGSLADRLDLPRGVSRADLTHLLKGQGLDGEALGSMGRGDKPHRPGLEMLFAADKSVSLSSLLPGGDPRIGAVRALAAERTFDLVERSFGFQRVTEDGVTRHRGGLEMLACRVRELVSRDNEPHEHVHMLVLNVTYDPVDERYRALDNTELYKAQSLLERGFHETEGRLIEALGYRIDRDRSDGTASIGGIDQKARDAFSSRHAAIEETAKELGGTSPEARSRAWDLTRSGKEKAMGADRFAAMRAQWGKTARDHGLEMGLKLEEAREGRVQDLVLEREQSRDQSRDLFRDAGRGREGGKSNERGLGRIIAAMARSFGQAMEPVLESLGLRPDKSHEREQAKSLAGQGRDGLAQSADLKPDLAVGLAVAHLEERSNILTRNQVRDLAMRAGDHRISLEAVCSALERREEAGIIALRPDAPVMSHGLTRNAPSPGDAPLRTARALDLERGLIETMKQGRGRDYGCNTGLKQAHSREPGLRAAIEARLEGLALNPDQKRAALELAAPTDRIQGVRGLPGVGKTLTLGVARELIESRGEKVLALAPTRAAVRELSKSAGFGEAHTVAWFVKKFERLLEPGARLGAQDKERWAGRALLIDEASFLSSRDARTVLDIAGKLDVRSIAFVGDDRQHGAMAAGAPFEMMRESGVRVIEIAEIRRQSDPLDRDAIRSLHRDEPTKALTSFDERGLVAEVSREDLARTVAERWLERSPQHRARTGIAAVTHAMRHEITGHIRAGLLDEGTLGREALEVRALEPTKRTPGEIDLAFGYQRGQTLVFGLSAPDQGIKADDMLRISNLNQKARTLTLERADGTTMVLSKEDREKLAGRYSVMEDRSLELREGDLVQVRRTDKAAGLDATSEAKVLGFDREGLRLEVNGKDMVLAKDAPTLAFLDHGYVRTTRNLQGASRPDMILAMGSDGLSANAAAMLVGASRHQDGLLIVTDSLERLGDGLSLRTGRQPLALTAKELAVERGQDKDRDMGQAFGRDKTPAHDRARGLEQGRGAGLGAVIAQSHDRGMERDRDRNFDTGRDMALEKALGSDLDKERTSPDRSKGQSLEQALAADGPHTRPDRERRLELAVQLQQIQDKQLEREMSLERSMQRSRERGMDRDDGPSFG